MSLKFDVLIIGGGIIGLAAALGMAARHHKVAVIDAGTFNTDIVKADVRVYAINKASQALLFKLGAWQHLNQQRVAPYEKMHVWDEVNGAYIDFDSRSIASPDLGSIIEESILKEALLRQIAEQPAVTLFPKSSIDAVNVSKDGVTVTAGDILWQGQLLMIADGANSPTRQKLQVGLTTWSYQQHALVATVTTEKAHKSTAYQVFKPKGPLAFLPLADAQQCSIVWSTKPMHVADLMSLHEDEFNDELTKAFASHLGEVKLASARHQFPLQMRHVKQYVGTRWLLLGDAAHTIHPLAGLGLNVGLADVATWLKYLDAHGNSLNSTKARNSYQRERKHAVWQTILLMEGFKQLFSISHTPITSLRGLGLRACNTMNPLKRLFVEHAAG